jgi:hypothetical protein
MERRRFLQILGALPLFGLFKPVESNHKVKPYALIDSFEYNLSTDKDWTFNAWYNQNTKWIHYAEVCVDGKVTRYIDGEKCT